MELLLVDFLSKKDNGPQPQFCKGAYPLKKVLMRGLHCATAYKLESTTL